LLNWLHHIGGAADHFDLSQGTFNESADPDQPDFKPMPLLEIIGQDLM